MKKLVVCNFKANGTKKDCEKFCDAPSNLVVCPPATLLFACKNKSVGAQDCSANENGSFTGEITAQMLKEQGCSYVLLNHSERRKFENKKTLLKKLENANKFGLKVIFCCGEKHSLNILHQLKKQLIVLNKINFKVILAYEPVWAIGSGRNCSVEHCLLIKKHIDKITKNYDKFLYGGSVDLKNYKQYLSCKQIDGVLVGRASLTENISIMAGEINE